MKVRYSPADEGGCGHYRLIWPAQHLASLGHDVARATPNVEDGTDVIVIQRPLRRTWHEDVIPTLQAHGVAVVVEIDDDFHAIDPENQAWRSCNPRYSPDSNYQHLGRAAALADLVTVTTPALAARYGSHGRVTVIPNYVPALYLDVKPTRTGPKRLGWTGTPRTHPGDLEQARAGVRAALEPALGWEFRAIGSPDTLRVLGLPGDVTPWQPTMSAYARAYAELSAAIVPLKPSQFNEGKSWLKGLEAAALGVPFVASSTGPYRSLGAGLIADKPRDWARALTSILEDDAFRQEVTDIGRATAAGLTVEGNSWQWIEAWATARANYKRRSVAA